MKNESEILNQITSFATNDKRIRMVLYNGSRVNDKVENDVLSD